MARARGGERVRGLDDPSLAFAENATTEEILRRVLEGVPDDEATRLLDDVERFVLRFCAFPNEHYGVAVALWIAHTHCIDAFEVTPRLGLISEIKQSGKSRVLEVIDLTAARPSYQSSMSVAFLFRSIDEERPTVLFDEVDAIFGPKARDNEDLRALINAGFRRSATVGRCVGDGSKQTPKRFPVFAAVAMAGIGDCLPDTILDRTIVLRMRRRAPDEQVEQLRYKQARAEAAPIRDALDAWGQAHVDCLELARPVMPEGIVDRPADTWEALIAIADEVGGDWPERARAACLALNDARAAEDSNITLRLLADIRGVLGADEVNVFSAALCQRLNALEEAPWGGWSDGKGIAPRDLAKRLRRVPVTSTTVRVGEDHRKGYRVADFTEAFARYLPSVTRVTSVTLRPSNGASVTDVTDVTAREPEGDDGARVSQADIDELVESLGATVIEVKAS